MDYAKPTGWICMRCKQWVFGSFGGALNGDLDAEIWEESILFNV